MTAESDLSPDRISVFNVRAGADRTHDVDPKSVIRRSGTAYTLHQNPLYYLNLANFTDAETTDNRSGIVMFCDNGEMQPVWNAPVCQLCMTGVHARKHHLAERALRLSCLIYIFFEQSYFYIPFIFDRQMYLISDLKCSAKSIHKQHFCAENLHHQIGIAKPSFMPVIERNDVRSVSDIFRHSVIFMRTLLFTI